MCWCEWSVRTDGWRSVWKCTYWDGKGKAYGSVGVSVVSSCGKLMWEKNVETDKEWAQFFVEKSLELINFIIKRKQMKLREVQKNIEDLQIKLEPARGLSDFAMLSQEVQAHLEKIEGEIKKRKITKYRRDFGDFKGGKVFKWQKNIHCDRQEEYEQEKQCLVNGELPPDDHHGGQWVQNKKYKESEHREVGRDNYMHNRSNFNHNRRPFQPRQWDQTPPYNRQYRAHSPNYPRAPLHKGFNRNFQHTSSYYPETYKQRPIQQAFRNQYKPQRPYTPNQKSWGDNHSNYQNSYKRTADFLDWGPATPKYVGGREEEEEEERDNKRKRMF